MKVANVTLLMTSLFLTANSVALAQSMLDPYAYVKAPTTQERVKQVTKKQKKIKERKVASKPESELDTQAPKPKSAQPATVIISENSPKLDEKEKEKEAPKTAKNDSEEGGFLSGLKESTGGIAKSGKAVGNSMLNGTKSVGTKIASGFKVAGEKVKDGTVAAGEKIGEAGGKVKDGGAGVGGKVAGGFKSAGGAIAALPKAVGGKLGGSGDGAKKIAAAPVAGIAAIGHGIGKMNPFHKDEADKSAADKATIAKKPETQKEEAVAVKPKQSLVPETQTEDQDLKNIEKELAKTEAQEAEKTAAAPKKEEDKALAHNDANKVAPNAVALKDGRNLRQKIAGAPMAGLGKTKQMLGHGIKLNPFHHGKDEGVQTAAKPIMQTEVKKDATAPASQTAASPVADETPIVERVEAPESAPIDPQEGMDGKDRIAAPESAIPH